MCEMHTASMKLCSVCTVLSSVNSFVTFYYNNLGSSADSSPGLTAHTQSYHIQRKLCFIWE